jgi:hypothetical protein
MITHLISTTEFVKLVDKDINIKGYCANHGLTLCFKYVDFISQKPELWMFLPTNDKEEILYEPFVVQGSYGVNYPKELEEYTKAKEKILFKNCTANIEIDEKEDTITYYITQNDKYACTCIKFGQNKDLFFLNGNTLERQCLGLKLTDNALKQIGL